MDQARSQFDKLPPQDLNAERGVLGSVLLFGDILDEVTPILTDEMFYLDAHRKIYGGVKRLRQRGLVIDPVTLADQLTKSNELDEVGGIPYLIQCLESVPHCAHAKYYAGIVRDKSINRRLIYSCTDVIAKAYDGNSETEELLLRAETSLQEILNDDRQESLTPISAAAIRAMDRLTSARPEGIDTGFTDLDSLVDGLKPGQLVVLAARPGVGKSAFAGNVTTNVSNAAPVFFASLEMTSDELIDRMAVSSLGISLGELRGWANGEQVDEVTTAVNQIGSLPIVINESPEQSVASITAQCRQMKRRSGLGLVIVDYLQLLTPSNSKDSREVQVSKIAWGLKGLAKSVGVPVIALAQLNREIDKRPDKTPRLSDLRESGGIEQAANVILFLDRPHVWEPSRSAHEAIIYVAKNRGGRTGRVDLLWEPRCATFRNQAKLGDDLDLENVQFGDEF